MDLLKIIKEKSTYFTSRNEDIGISSIVSHIEIAEKHFEGGQSGKEYLFNDVIYRSNQAFEGALKEAYRIIEGKDPEKITPHKIEKYFEENSILKERVLNYLRTIELNGEMNLLITISYTFQNKKLY